MKTAIHITVLLLLTTLSACEGTTHRDPDACQVGQCLQEDANWSECYKACTCGCWKEDSKGYYPDDVVLQPFETIAPAAGTY